MEGITSSHETWLDLHVMIFLKQILLKDRVGMLQNLFRYSVGLFVLFFRRANVRLELIHSSGMGLHQKKMNETAVIVVLVQEPMIPPGILSKGADKLSF